MIQSMTGLMLILFCASEAEAVPRSGEATLRVPLSAAMDPDDTVLADDATVWTDEIEGWAMALAAPVTGANSRAPQSAAARVRRLIGLADGVVFRA
ncbi:hypothetical protein AA310_02290 [Arthrobacter sp. YC-RL1]|uniref:Uncharacterized protein n=1 Tax=Glutamicibacter soli TaxID=453836 RepID=A0A365YDQ0_9MICC|nr:hypothetical protein AFL94_01950 [Arthrobacter sp. LS16]ALQ31913.1 hypothetical protein ATC04_16100 [Arthrobacter sp. YC-RL1]KLI90219.1 hypothetical protein AA310_02290 [Arthrobacter sp. YC-RL1]RBM00143.1 hypothetical protein C1H84_13550 [Glutamicibacter soli]